MNMTDKGEVNDEVRGSPPFVEKSIEQGNDTNLEASALSSHANSIEAGTLQQRIDNSSSLISEPRQAESTLLAYETQNLPVKDDSLDQNLSEPSHLAMGKSFDVLEANNSVSPDSFQEASLDIKNHRTEEVAEPLPPFQTDEGNIDTEAQARSAESILVQCDKNKLNNNKDVTNAGSLDHSENNVTGASLAQIERVENVAVDLNDTSKKENTDEGYFNSPNDAKAELGHHSAQRDVKIEKDGVPHVEQQQSEPEECIANCSDIINEDARKAKAEKSTEAHSDILKEEASSEENLIALNVENAETENFGAVQNESLEEENSKTEHLSTLGVEKTDTEPKEIGADSSDEKNVEAFREVHDVKAEPKNESAERVGIFKEEIPGEENLNELDVENSDVEKYSNDSEYDIDQVRNYGTSILAIAESSRATRLHERFQSGRTGMGKKTTDSNVTVDPLQSHSSNEREEASTGGDAAIKRAGATHQPTVTSRNRNNDESATNDKLQAATIRRDGIAVEPHRSDSGINHYKITLTKEMQEEIQREKLRIAEEEAQGGILGRVSKGVGSYLAQRRQRREQLALERKIAEANRALEEMRRASDSFESIENEDDIWGDLKVEIEPEPPTKFRHVPPILTKSMIAEFVKHYLPASLRLLKWKRVYSLSRDGDSFQTFLANVEKWHKTLLVVRTNREDLFGAFCDDAWGGLNNEMETPTYYGSGQSFLFKISKAKSEDVSFAPHNSVQETEQIVAFKWTGANRYVQLCDPSKKLIAMGGGGVTSSFGLCLEDDFSVGSSGPCETFGNEPLASQEHFDILDLEVWGFMTAF